MGKAPEAIDNSLAKPAEKQEKQSIVDRFTSKKPKLLEKALLLLIVLAISFVGGWYGSANRNSQDVKSGIIQQRTVLKNEGNVISSIASDVGKSVVSVNVMSQTTATNNAYGYFFGYGSGSQTQESAGTGIILTSNGLIITNRHVVPSGTTSVSVTLSDGTVLDDVKVLGRTSDNDTLDIAFLQVNDKKGKTLTPATLGDSSLMNVGDTVIAIGNALGQFQNTVTSGILSGYGRSIQASDGSSSTESLEGLFQTDAAINEGNSGGPLVNLAGEVIGINTAIASDSQNVGFAIPINDVVGLIKSVEETGTVERPYLGVRYVLLTDDIAKEYNLKVSRGAYIPQQTSTSGETVMSDSPASEAGIKPGDVITRIDGSNIDEKTSLASLLSRHKPGDKITVTLQRGSSTKTVSVTLSSVEQ